MLGLYVHIPFCAAICNYCNFNRGLFDETLFSGQDFDMWIRLAQVCDCSRAGKEVVSRIFCVDAALNRMALPVDIFLLERQWLTRARLRKSQPLGVQKRPLEPQHGGEGAA